MALVTGKSLLTASFAVAAIIIAAASQMTPEKRQEAAAKAAAEAAEAQNKEKACAADLSCWADKHQAKASAACRPYIERLAEYQFEWTGAWDSRFTWKKWKDQSKGQLSYFGDEIKFQNGFGAWKFFTYTCDYDPIVGAVLSVSANPGRLPQWPPLN